jgi:flavodoxin
MGKQALIGFTVIFLSILFAAVSFIDGGNLSAKTPAKTEKNKLGKVLIVYYSLSGNTRLVAKAIQDLTDGDLVELKPVENYNRPDIEAAAKKQVSEGYKPKLQNAPISIDEYDYIFVGSPVWWFSYAPPVGTFLSQHNFKSKKVVPFWTYIDVDGHIYSDFKGACRGGRVLEGKDFTSAELKDMKKVRAKIGDWLREVEK